MKRRTRTPRVSSGVLFSFHIIPLLLLVFLWMVASPYYDSSVVVVECFSSASSSTMRTFSKDSSVSMTPPLLLLRHHHRRRSTQIITESRRRRKNKNSRGIIITTSSTRSTSPSTSTASSTSLSMMNSLIPYNDEWGNLAVLTGTSVLAQILGTKTRIGKLLGSPVSAMAITFLLASVGILYPGGTITSRKLQLLSISFATPLILLGANFGTTNSSSSGTSPLLIGFMIASIGTVVGSMIGWLLVGKTILSTLSIFGINDGLKIISALVAKNIGGGINYIAVCAALNASPEAIATGLCVDNFMALLYFPICNVIANQYNDPNNNEYENNEYDTDTDSESFTSSSSSSVSTTGSINNSGTNKKDNSMTVESISIAFFAACGLLWMGELISTNIFNSLSSQIPIVTLLSVIVASGIVTKIINITPINSIVNKVTAAAARSVISDSDSDGVSGINMNQLRSTCGTLGTVCLYLFFATAGAPGMRVAKSMKSALLPLSIFSMCLYTIHGMVLYSSYKLFGIQQPKKKNQIGKGKRYGFEFRRQKKKQQQDDKNKQKQRRGTTSLASKSSSSSSSSSWRDAFSPQRLLIASSSAIGGPATSVALARSVKWESLIVPALLVGNIGYAIATFIGIGFYYCFAAAL